MRKIHNAGWLTLEQAIRLGAGLLVMTLVARHLGPAAFGTYTYLLGLAGMFLPIAMFGLEAVIMRSVIADPANRDRTIGAAVVIRIIGAFVAALSCIIFVFAFGGPAGVTATLMAIAALTLVGAPGESLNAVLKADEKMVWVALPRIVVILGSAAGAVLLVANEAEIPAFLGLRAVEMVFLALAALVAYGFATGALGRLRPSFQLVPSLVRQGLPLMISGAVMVIYIRVDQVMLGLLAEEEELGQYGVAARIAELSFFVPAVIQATLYAWFVRSHTKEPTTFDSRMQQMYDAVGLASWLAVAGTALGGVFLLEPVFGQAFADALPMLLVLLIGLPFYFQTIAWAMMLTVRGWFWTAPAITGFGAAVNVALNLILIPELGGLGAAWATVAAYVIAGYGCSFFVPRLRPAAFGMTRALNPIGAVKRLRLRWSEEMEKGR